MKFDYAYRDRSNERHDGVIKASSKDEVYKLLRAQGIKPFFVARSPGICNYLLSLGKSGLLIFCLSVFALLALVVMYCQGRVVAMVKNEANTPLTRRQVYGDPALLERMEQEDYSEVFELEGDRVLAHFAQPAQLQRYVVQLRGSPVKQAVAAIALEKLYTRHLRKNSIREDVASSTRETGELKRIVAWMHNEFVTYMSNGNGTPHSYLKRLIERQYYEAQLYNRVKVELKSVSVPDVWEKKNEMLRAIGAPTIPMPIGGGMGGF